MQMVFLYQYKGHQNLDLQETQFAKVLKLALNFDLEFLSSWRLML